MKDQDEVQTKVVSLQDRDVSFLTLDIALSNIALFPRFSSI